MMLKNRVKSLTFPELVEWASTAILIVGVALTAFYIYPLNVWVSLIANLGWLLVAWYWRKWSLGIVQLIVSAIYIAGLINYYFFS